MKRLLILVLLVTVSCKSIYRGEDKNIAQHLYIYHLKVVEQFLEINFMKEYNDLEESVDFLQDMTGIECEVVYQFRKIYYPNKKDVKKWRAWYKKNEDRLYWDEEKMQAKLRD